MSYITLAPKSNGRGVTPAFQKAGMGDWVASTKKSQKLNKKVHNNEENCRKWQRGGLDGGSDYNEQNVRREVPNGGAKEYIATQAVHFRMIS